MEYILTIYGRLPGLNEYTAANRTNPYKGAQMKRDSQNIVCMYIRQQLRSLRIKRKVELEYTFYEINKRRDHDNVTAMAHKSFRTHL